MPLPPENLIETMKHDADIKVEEDSTATALNEELFQGFASDSDIRNLSNVECEVKEVIGIDPSVEDSEIFGCLSCSETFSSTSQFSLHWKKTHAPSTMHMSSPSRLPKGTSFPKLGRDSIQSRKLSRKLSPN